MPEYWGGALSPFWLRLPPTQYEDFVVVLCCFLKIFFTHSLKQMQLLPVKTNTQLHAILLLSSSEASHLKTKRLWAWE